jgi:Cu/Ag efflux protein CusF
MIGTLKVEYRSQLMKKLKSILTATMLACSIVGASAQSKLTDGQVIKVDASANKITIKHGPMKKLDMEDGMTMVYVARESSMLANIKAGDKIKFDAEQVNGQFTVTKIERSK